MGYCCSSERTKKFTNLLFHITARKDTDELEITTFCVRNEEFNKKKLRIFRYFKSSDIHYIVQVENIREMEHYIIYLLVNTGENYFFSLNFCNGAITELALPEEVGSSPTFQKLNNFYFILIGGANEKNCGVHLYDIYGKVWYFVGTMQGARWGAYALLNNEESEVYICGGSSPDGDNSFDIEHFSLVYPMKDGESKICLDLGSGFYPQEIKTKKIKNDYLLRKINPAVLPLFDDTGNTYLICGGGNIFNETSTCILFHTDRDFISLTNKLLPLTFSETLTSRNICTYKNSCFFFAEPEKVVAYSILENNFEIIMYHPN